MAGCAAFFVENTAGKTYVVTARHCVNHAITKWCDRSGTFIDKDGNRGVCKKIIAADLSRDIAMFEASMARVPDNSRTLRLAAYQPKVGTRIKMIGFPGDRYRRGALTVTENCWVLQESAKSPYQYMRERSSLHNCTTYSGNSGGPMIAEGTRDALGLPFTYVPNDYYPRSSNNLKTAAYMAQMADFVTMHREKLQQAGVVIAEEPATVEGGAEQK